MARIPNAGFWTPPDGKIGVTSDVVAILDKFSARPSAPAKARCDLEPATPDLKINITDVISALDAFRGAKFPLAVVPSSCGG